jgi:hypothetical protein
LLPIVCSKKRAAGAFSALLARLERPLDFSPSCLAVSALSQWRHERNAVVMSEELLSALEARRALRNACFLPGREMFLSEVSTGRGERAEAVAEVNKSSKKQN